ncbi:MAG: hypothetical protein ACPGTU_10885 [Myxococcota bacterium]
MIHLLTILSILSVGRAETPPTIVRADLVLAVVSDSVVTESDIRLHREMSTLDPSPVPSLQHNEADAIQNVIDATVIRSLAGRVPVYQPSTTDIRARWSLFQNQWTDPAAYNAFMQIHGLNQDRLYQVLKQRMIIERVVQRNLGNPSESDKGSEWNKAYIAWLEQQRSSIRIRKIDVEKDQ